MCRDASALQCAMLVSSSQGWSMQGAAFLVPKDSQQRHQCQSKQVQSSAGRVPRCINMQVCQESV